MSILKKNILRIKSLMEIEKDEVELEEDELDEDEGGATDTTTSTASQNAGTVKKWESGLTRGKGNQIATAKWESGTTKGPGNKTATEKWSSGRKYGPTGNYI
jgi:hypothetical protein